MTNNCPDKNTQACIEVCSINCDCEEITCNSQSREPVLGDRSTGRSLLKFAGTWVGDDINECLESVDDKIVYDPDAELIEPVIQGDNNA